SLVLTTRGDVIVREHAGADMAVDLLVEVLKNGKAAMRFFGVQMVGSIDLPDIKDADKRVLAHLSRGPSEAALPICAFVIGVRKPEGIYRWVVQPVIDGGRALLDRNGEPTWHTLDEEGAARLIDQVSAWYDALQGDLTPKKGKRGRDGQA